MDEQLKSKLREILLDRYEIDIVDAVCHFSTQNYAFIFPGKPYMLRVSITPKKTRQEIMSELMWVDDLKQFKQTICEPNMSAKGNLLEEFEIDGQTYRASMFRTARGNVQATVDMTPMFFICVGDLLGTIHHVSTNEREIGMHYKRKTLSEIFEAQKERVWESLTPEIQGRIEDIQKKVDSLPQEAGVYGICHGDFHINNFFVESNNVWLFDFDGCTYANYLYDVASFIQSCFLFGYGAGKDCRKVLDEAILPYFKIGYELNHNVGERYWDDLELFFAYRTSFTLLMLSEIDKCGVTDNIDQIKKFFTYIILQDDIFAAMTDAMTGMGTKRHEE